MKSLALNIHLMKNLALNKKRKQIKGGSRPRKRCAWVCHGKIANPWYQMFQNCWQKIELSR